MVSDLVYFSHPDKYLEKHIFGVLNNTSKRTNSKIAEIAVLFHDLGKINPNFQQKIKLENKGKNVGYSSHAYISMYVFLCYVTDNQILTKEYLGCKDIQELKLAILQLSIIIAKHHGHIPDFDKSLSRETFEEAERFLRDQDLPFTEFYKEKLLKTHNFFKVKPNPNLWELTRFVKKLPETWQKDALKHFFEVQYSFASLIEADKRDAGDVYLKNYYHFDSTIKSSTTELQIGLNDKFTHFSSFKDISHLDRYRTLIRNEAVDKIQCQLNLNRRVYTLTAPTGSGKTFALLALASKIQSVKGENLGVIYCLPFLSITEQVESISKELVSDVLSVNAKSRNVRIEEAQDALENNQSEENLSKLLQEDFIQHTFDHPFIVTTFVQLFETLLSNHNSTLLKLPNFSNRIFLIDEVQALPPKLYIFFIAWIDEFCRRNNSYAIISTATMPMLDFGIKKFVDDKRRPDLLFKGYVVPTELLDAKHYFEADTFNRYRINFISENDVDLDYLIEHIQSQTQSCLIILNTIKDSKMVYNRLKDADNVFLLNTQFTAVDRREKIELVKSLLQSETVILISTQLIEAGVDIDFPIVYRDLCPLPSLIQSAGRCNRNKKHSFGQVFFFHFLDSNGKSSAEKVYRGDAKRFLYFCKQHILDGIEEKELFKIQAQFFQEIARDLSIGEYEMYKERINLIECVNNAEFETIGKFKLISDREFGFEYQYYIPESETDVNYEEAVKVMFKMVKSEEFSESKKWKIELNQRLKKLADRVITIRTFEKDESKLPRCRNMEYYFDIRVLGNLDIYSFEFGFEHDSIKDSLL